MRLIITFLLTIYLAVGALSAMVIWNYARQCGDDYDIIDFLMITLLWPSYLGIEDEEDDNNDDVEN